MIMCLLGMVYIVMCGVWSGCWCWIFFNLVLFVNCLKMVSVSVFLGG